MTYRIILTLWVGCWVGLLAGLDVHAADKSGVTSNAISLPSGPGSIEGLGESFQPTLNTGTAKYRVALGVPPGTAGHAPELSLQYDGGGSNGIMGFGWSLGMPFVQRQSDKGIPRYIDAANSVDDDRDGDIDEPDEIDVYINEFSEELVPTAGGFFFCETEGAFIRYQRVGDHWEGTRPDGSVMTFGMTSSGRVEDSGTEQVYRWLLEKLTDTNGNTILFSYTSYADTTNTRQKYLSKIEYGPGSPPWTHYHFANFVYEDRSDWFEDARAGFIVRTGKRLKEIVIGTQGPTLSGHASGDFNADTQPDYLNRRYRMAYDGHTYWSLLTAITWVGADDAILYPSLVLDYTVADLPDTVLVGGDLIGSANTPLQVMDNDLVDLVDLNADGLPDILKTELAGGPHTAFLNRGEIDDQGNPAIAWGSATAMASTDGLAWNINLESTSGTIAHLADMDADGLADLVYKTTIGDVYFFGNTILGWAARAAMNVDPTDSAPPSPFGVQHVKTADIDFDKHMDIIQSIDVGIGADYRVWFNLGDQQFARSTTVSQTNGFMLSDDGVHITDFNGDRVPDIVRVRPTGVQVTAGLGYGRFAPLVTVSLPDYTFTTPQVAQASFQDISGDGLTDLVIERPAPGQLWYWINRGNYTLDNRRMLGGLPALVGTDPAIRWADMNGNGTTDLVYADRFSDPRIMTIDIGRLIGCVPNANMLVRIDNGIGRVTTIEYATSTRFMLEDLAAGHTWPHPLPFPVNVVSQMKVADGMGNLYITDFKYHNGYYDGEEKEFRGFARAEQINIGDVTAPDLVMAYTFDTGVQDRALKGKLLRSEASNGANEVFYRDQFTWEATDLYDSSVGDGRKVKFPAKTEKLRDVIEKGNGPPLQVKWEFAYDAFGNRIRKVEHGRMDSGWDDERVTEITYTADYPDGVQNWILRGVVELKILDENSVMAAHTRNYYDGNLVLGMISQGNLTMTENWVSGAAFIASERSDFDPYGNVVTQYDPIYGSAPGHYREIEYDSSLHTFPVKERIYTGNADVPVLTAEATYDLGFGVVITSTNFNGHMEHYEFDPFARLTAVTKPPAAAHTVEYDYVLGYDLGSGHRINWIERRLNDTSPGDGFRHSRTYYDGLSREIMTRDEGEVPGQIVVRNAYAFNAQKLPWKKYLPYFDNATLDYADVPPTADYSEHIYDALGRETSVKHPGVEGSSAENLRVYGPLSRTVQDEEQTLATSPHFGAGRRYITDGFLDDSGNGRLRQIFEIVRISDSGEPFVGAPVEWQTSYKYDLLDNVTQIVDAQNNTKSYAYDGLRRRISMDDPDRGHMEYTYDDAGNLIRTLDNKGQVVTYAYDGINRLTSEDYLDTAGVTPDIAYYYDTASSDYPYAENTKGKLAWVKDLSGATFYSYDERGNALWSTIRIIDQGIEIDFRTLHEYDMLDRIITTVLPDGDQIVFNYNDRGLLESIPNIVQSVAYRPSEQIANIVYGNDVVTDYAYDARQRLINAQASPTGQPSILLQGLSYEFDQVSNLVSIVDNRGLTSDSPQNASQSFQYDDLYRLIEASGSGYGKITYRYDRLGNAVYKSSPALPDPNHIENPEINLGAIINGGTLGASDRGPRSPGDPPGPHAVTATASGLTFEYDDNGNMTRHGNGDIYSWDFMDRLTAATSSSSATTYVYDYNGQRVIKKSMVNGATSTTYYINEHYEVRNGQAIKYIFAENRRVAQIDGSSTAAGEQTWQFIDLQEGWNYVGLAVEPIETSVADVIQPISDAVIGVWAYDNTSGEYVGYLPSAGIFDLTTLHSQKGYIINVSRHTVWPVYGTKTTDPISLYTGWNLVASPVNTSMSISEAFAPISNHLEAVWAYIPSADGWQAYFPDGPSATNTIESIGPGVACWLKTAADTSLPFLSSAPQVFYYHADHLSGTNLVTDDAGQVAETTEFFPYGLVRFEAHANFNSYYKFTDKELDSETGLIYSQTRYYEPILGSFISVDPLGQEQAAFVGRPQAANAYAYAMNNPLAYTDPSGMDTDEPTREEIAGQIEVANQVSDAVGQLASTAQFSAGMLLGETATITLAIEGFGALAAWVAVPLTMMKIQNDKEMVRQAVSDAVNGRSAAMDDNAVYMEFYKLGRKLVAQKRKAATATYKEGVDSRDLLTSPPGMQEAVNRMRAQWNNADGTVNMIKKQKYASTLNRLLTPKYINRDFTINHLKLKKQRRQLRKWLKSQGFDPRRFKKRN